MDRTENMQKIKIFIKLKSSEQILEGYISKDKSLPYRLSDLLKNVKDLFSFENVDIKNKEGVIISSYKHLLVNKYDISYTGELNDSALINNEVYALNY